MEIADGAYACIILERQLDACVQVAEWTMRSPLPIVGVWASSSRMDSEI